MTAKQAEVVAALQAWAREHGAPPSFNIWREARLTPSTSAAQTAFGSWGAAMEAAGLPRRGRGEYKRPLVRTGPCGNPACDRRRDGEGARGLCNRCYRYKLATGRDWNDPRGSRRRRLQQQAIIGIRELAAQLGRLPTFREYRAYARDREDRAKRPDALFGSWGDAVEAAGFSRPQPGFLHPAHPQYRQAA